MASTIGIINTANPSAIEYCVMPIAVNPNADARNGTYITSVVHINEAAVAHHINLLCLIRSTDLCRDLILNEWKISAIESARNAIVIPTAEFAIAHVPVSI